MNPAPEPRATGHDLSGILGHSRPRVPRDPCATAITGRTVVGVDSAVVSGTFTQSGIHFQAQTGNQFIDLAGVTSNSTTSGVTQTVPTTVGQTYRLQFQVGSAQGGGFFFPSTIDVSVNDGPRISHTNPATPSTALDWKPFTLSFVATTPNTKITFFNGGASNNYSSSLDGASLEPVNAAVPALGAPGGAALLGALGFLATSMLGRAARRDRALLRRALLRRER